MTTSTPPTPQLDQKYSGIPSRLYQKAQKAKSLILDIATSKAQWDRKRGVAIPQGIERSTFTRALDDLSRQLGKSYVELVDQPLKDGWYMENPNTHDGMHILDPEEFVASAIAYPGSTEDVQKIILWANKYKVPIFPISLGRNFGYGGAAPRVRGSVVVDLGRRMNKILDINPDDCTCLVEPGVTYYALYEEIKKRGYENLWIDTPDLGGGSVLGNALDRGVGYTLYGDHWAAHSGMEVVLPTGEVMRTGMGAMPNSSSWQLFPYGFGPYNDGLFSQSNLGICTKMGMTLMPNPGGHETFAYTFEKEEDLTQLVEIIRPLRISMILENVAQFRHVKQTVAIMGKPRSAYFQGKGPMPDDLARNIAAKELHYGNFTWIYYGTTYGPPDIRKFKLDIIDREFKKVPGARQVDPAKIPKTDYFWSRARIAAGEPDMEELSWVNWYPNGGHVAFSPVSPVRGPDASNLWRIAKTRAAEFGLDTFPTWVVGLREMHIIVEVVYNKDDKEQCKNALAAMRAMIDDSAKLGYGEYRTHLALMDQIAGTYNWNNNILMRFNERIKDALDPNGILAPGKSGVWPARYRGRGWELTSKDLTRSEGNGVNPATGSNKL